ncbi:hypothetical protein TNCV_1594801 [Trichonephila clavipes]|nr:hypothetical protein TNCV_1594801 [Trichonephila clavipes]
MSQVRMDYEARVPRYWPKSCRGGMHQGDASQPIWYYNSYCDPLNIRHLTKKVVSTLLKFVGTFWFPGPKEFQSELVNIKVPQVTYSRALIAREGCGSPVNKVSDHERHVMSSSPVPLKTRRIGMHVDHADILKKIIRSADFVKERKNL